MSATLSPPMSLKRSEEGEIDDARKDRRER